MGFVPDRSFPMAGQVRLANFTTTEELERVLFARPPSAPGQ